MRFSRFAPYLAIPILLLSGTVTSGGRGDAPAAGIAVDVRGEVAAPGRYVAAPGERISDLLRRCGGATAGAYLPGAALYRRSEKERGQGEVSAWNRRLAAVGQPLAAWIGSREASGRVIVAIAHPRLMIGTPSDIPLEDGDLLVVPGVPGSVRVAGAVARPSDVPFAPGMDAEHYIRRVGGTTTGGDAGRVLVRKSDGRVLRLRNDRVAWSEARARWELSPWGDPPATIEAGDLLYVPDARVRALPDGTAWPDVLRALLSLVEDPPPSIAP